MTTIVLTPMSVGFSQLEQVYRDGISPQLDPIVSPLWSWLPAALQRRPQEALLFMV